MNTKRSNNEIVNHQFHGSVLVAPQSACCPTLTSGERAGTKRMSNDKNL